MPSPFELAASAKGAEEVEEEVEMGISPSNGVLSKEEPENVAVLPDVFVPAEYAASPSRRRLLGLPSFPLNNALVAGLKGCTRCDFR